MWEIERHERVQSVPNAAERLVSARIAVTERNRIRVLSAALRNVQPAAFGLQCDAAVAEGGAAERSAHPIGSERMRGAPTRRFRGVLRIVGSFGYSVRMPSFYEAVL